MSEQKFSVTLTESQWNMVIESLVSTTRNMDKLLIDTVTGFADKPRDAQIAAAQRGDRITTGIIVREEIVYAIRDYMNVEG